MKNNERYIHVKHWGMVSQCVGFENSSLHFTIKLIITNPLCEYYSS